MPYDTTKLVDAQNAIQQVIDYLNTPVPVPIPPPVPVPPPVVTPQPVPQPPARGLPAIQAWLGTNTLGVYVGIESVSWRAPDFAPVAENLANMNVDYALVKFGERGPEWYDGTLADIKNEFFKRGVGMAPYLYCLPSNVADSIAIANHMCQVCGGVVLDCEDEWQGHDAELATLLNTIRANNPNACIILSGYGDPHFRFGDNYPHHTIATSGIDGYQPQLYFGVWDVYKQSGWQAAIDWGMTDCGSVLGQNMVMQPAITCEGVDLAHFAPCATYLKRWHASMVLWEYQLVTPEIVAECKKGLAS